MSLISARTLNSIPLQSHPQLPLRPRTSLGLSTPPILGIPRSRSTTLARNRHEYRPVRNACNRLSLYGKLPDAVEELTMRHSLACFTLALTLCSAGARGQSMSPAPAPLTVIRAGTLIDGVSEAPRKNQLIFVRGERIEKVADASAKIPEGTKVIDLSTATVLPGLIDAHTHIFLWGEDPAKGGYDENILKAGIALRAARATYAARRALEQGFTTIRDVETEGAGYGDIEIKQAIVDEAHGWQKKVACHAYNGIGLQRALDGGCDSIEHGLEITDIQIAQMQRQGTWYCPTLSPYYDDWARPETPEGKRDRARAAVHEISFKKALQAHLKIVYGTDMGGIPWTEPIAQEFKRMVSLGMTPMDAIQSATSRAAEMLDMKGEIGVIASGAYAEVVAVSGDPLKDAGELEHVRFVMHNGAVFKNEMAK